MPWGTWKPTCAQRVERVLRTSIAQSQALTVTQPLTPSRLRSGRRSP